MDKFGVFILDQWILFLALIMIITLLVFNSIKQRVLGFKEMKPAEAVQFINHNDAVILDVRDDKEFNDGHVINAFNIPLGVLEGRLPELERYKSKPIIISCRTGQQSAHAGVLLRRNGFEAIYKLAGGMMAWQSANMPTVKSEIPNNG